MADEKVIDVPSVAKQVLIEFPAGWIVGSAIDAVAVWLDSPISGNAVTDAIVLAGQMAVTGISYAMLAELLRPANSSGSVNTLALWAGLLSSQNGMQLRSSKLALDISSAFDRTNTAAQPKSVEEEETQYF